MISDRSYPGLAACPPVTLKKKSYELRTFTSHHHDNYPNYGGGGGEKFPKFSDRTTFWRGCCKKKKKKKTFPPRYPSVTRKFPHLSRKPELGLKFMGPILRTYHQWQFFIQWQIKWNSWFWLAMKHCCHGSSHWMASCHWWQVLWNRAPGLIKGRHFM